MNESYRNGRRRRLDESGKRWGRPLAYEVRKKQDSYWSLSDREITKGRYHLDGGVFLPMNLRIELHVLIHPHPTHPSVLSPMEQEWNESLHTYIATYNEENKLYEYFVYCIYIYNIL